MKSATLANPKARPGSRCRESERASAVVHAHPCTPACIDLAAVRRWAVAEGIDRKMFFRTYQRAMLVSVSRLVQALYREGLVHCELTLAPSGKHSLSLGSAALRLRVPIAPLCFGRIELKGRPQHVGPRGRVFIRSAGRFLRTLASLGGSEPLTPFRAELQNDFENSMANLVLNELIATRRPCRRPVGEPAHKGHGYYPFPALRLGPLVPDVIGCSNLRAEGVELQAVETTTLSFRSLLFAGPQACYAAWSGASRADGGSLIPVHPWQLSGSPVVQELIRRQVVKLRRGSVARVLPLASQRTCEVEHTGFSLKLSLDATLTGERRLLYEVNRENAPAVSALASHLLDASGMSACLGLQRDVATLSFSDSRFAAHLAAIVREPLRPFEGEALIPAINLWAGPMLANGYLARGDAEGAARFFSLYCDVLTRGPLLWLTRGWMAFEPYLQNTVIGLTGRDPTRLVLRDLDGTLLGTAAARADAEHLRLPMSSRTWNVMPAFEVGERRCVHAMFFGHLADVMSFMQWRCNLPRRRMWDILCQRLHALHDHLEAPAEKRCLQRILGHVDSAKNSLSMRLSRSSTMAFTPLPDALRTRFPAFS